MNQQLTDLGTKPLAEPTPILKLVQRPGLDLATLYRLVCEEPQVPAEVLEQVEIKYKYDGYLKRQEETARKLAQWGGKRIPEGFEYYDAVPGLSNEVRHKLKEVRPRSLGQAARISGVTPAALGVLMVSLKRFGAGAKEVGGGD